MRAPAASTCTAYPEDQLTVTALWFRLLFSPFLITGSGDMDGLPKVRPTVYLFVCLKNGCSDILFSRYTVIWIFFVVVVCIFLSMVLNYSEQGLLKNFISSLHQLLCLRGDFYQSICSNKKKKKWYFLCSGIIFYCCNSLSVRANVFLLFLTSMLQNSPNNMAGMNNPPGTPRDDGEMAGNFLNPFQSESVSTERENIRLKLRTNNKYFWKRCLTVKRVTR